MNINSILAALTAFFLLLCCARGFAAETNNAVAELNDLVARINTRLKQSTTNRTDLTDNIKEFDALFAKCKDGNSEDLSMILLVKARLYLEVMNDPEKALPIFEQLKQDFPLTKVATNSDGAINSLKTMIEKRRIQRSLVEGTTFPDFSEKDTVGKPLSIGNYRGKVVLVDFWATWCGPCIAELPNVLNVYQKHHGKGFEIIGISLDEDKDRLVTFTNQKNVPWPQYFDGKGWANKLAAKYGIDSIPATYLLDREGKIIAKDLRGSQLDSAVTKALATK